jgi:phosphatidylglycerophosphate synthase
MLSVGGLFAHAMAGACFALNQLGWGLALLLVGQLLDTFDGELARRHSRASAFGGFLDSVCDHLGDFAVYLGLLWHFLNVDQHIEVVLIATAMFGSVFGSHVRSRAGMSGIDTKAFGVFTRFERTLVLTIGILLNQLTIGLWILAISNNFSALQRIIHVVRAARSGVSPARG